VNFIVICLDTLRWDHLGCYGNQEIQTPGIDGLAERATRFEAAYCASFPTIPMRTDAFTGNVNWPVYGWKPLGEEEVTVTACLKEAGYHTAFIHDTGNMVSGGFGADFDEDIFLGPPEGWEANEVNVELPVPREHMRQSAGGFIRDRAQSLLYEHESDWPVARTMMAASEWLEDNYKREGFFLWVDSFEIHEDWHAPEHYTEHYSSDYQGLDYSYPNYGYTDIYQPHELQRMRDRYAAEVSLTDRWVAHLLRQIETTRLFDNSMVVLLSDHGMYIGEHERTGKHTVDPTDAWPIYDEVGRLPLLISMPGSAEAKTTRSLVQPADLMPTILELGGVEQSAQPEMYGKSMVRLLAGETDRHHDHVFSSCHSGSGPGRIEYLPSCITVTRPPWTLVTGPASWEPRLHHSGIDPGQTRNLIGRHPQVAELLREALVEFMASRGAEKEYVEGFTGI